MARYGSIWLDMARYGSWLLVDHFGSLLLFMDTLSSVWLIWIPLIYYDSLWPLIAPKGFLWLPYGFFYLHLIHKAPFAFIWCPCCSYGYKWLSLVSNKSIFFAHEPSGTFCCSNLRHSFLLLLGLFLPILIDLTKSDRTSQTWRKMTKHDTAWHSLTQLDTAWHSLTQLILLLTILHNLAQLDTT